MYRLLLFAIFSIVATVTSLQARALDCSKDEADAIAAITRSYDREFLAVDQLKGLYARLGKVANPSGEKGYRKIVADFNNLVLRRNKASKDIKELSRTCKQRAAQLKIRHIAASFEKAADQLAADILVYSMRDRTVPQSAPGNFAMASPGFAAIERPVDTNTELAEASPPFQSQRYGKRARSTITGSAEPRTNVTVPDVVDRADAETRANGTGQPAPAGSDPVDAEIKKLIEGHVAFNNPMQMRMARPYTIQAVLSKTLSVPDLKAHLLDQSGVDSAGLLVGKRMRVTLNGGSAFDVSPPGPQTQWVTDTAGPTTWTWSVTPKLDGKQALILTFDAVLKVDGTDDFRNITTLKREIEVDVGWPSTVSEWIAYLKKTMEDFKFLWAAILVPVGGWILTRWRKKTAVPTP